MIRMRVVTEDGHHEQCRPRLHDGATRIAASARTGSLLHLGSVPKDVLSTEMLNEYYGAIPTIPASAIRAIIVGEHATFDPVGFASTAHKSTAT